MKPQNKSVAIYARVSTDKQTVDMQLRELREYVKRRTWKLHAEYIDRGFTGSDCLIHSIRTLNPVLSERLVSNPFPAVFTL